MNKIIIILETILMAFKSYTSRAAIAGVATLATLNIEQDEATSLISKILEAFNLHGNYYPYIVAFVTLLTTLGVIKGTKDRPKKPPLEKRKLGFSTWG